MIELHRRVQSVFPRYGVGGDYRAIDMILVIVGLILVGGRRLDHLNYVCSDPMVKRFCGLLRLPRERSVSRWLKRFTQKSLGGFGGNQQRNGVRGYREGETRPVDARY